jgi:hypothetical protein
MVAADQSRASEQYLTLINVLYLPEIPVQPECTSTLDGRHIL